MFSGEKSLVNEKNFSSSDLIQHIELLVKESKHRERRNSLNSNYSWLKSRNPIDEMDDTLDHFNNIVLKLSSESCATIAVKLDRLADESHLSPAAIFTSFSKLLEEEQNMRLLENTVREKKKITPMLEGRRASVSFIFNKKNNIAEYGSSVP